MITQRFDDPDSLVDGQLVKRPERQCIRHSCKQRTKPLNTAHLAHWWWIGLSSVLRPRQHSIGYMGDGFYRSKDPTNSYQSTEGKSTKENNPENRERTIHEKTDRPRFSICNQREIGGSEPVFSS